MLTENETFLDEIVVSASRTPERIMESPVTIERLDSRAIKNTTSPSFYDGLENLKGVDINSNSLTFSSLNTRGFATFANTRFVQLVDGMDNSSPALNFAIGNFLGLNELDVELLPGASSALYGANAFNGIMFMTSKSPFDDQGISLSLKGGLTSQEAGGDNEFTDFSIRLAHAFSNKFAAKATLSVLEGTDWTATDYRNTRNGEMVSGDRNSDRNYNGVNVYGDAASANMRGVAQTLEGLGLIPGGASALIPSESISRTGYNEKDLMDYGVKSVKFGASLNYRPFGDDRLEVIWNSKVGTGTTQYLGGQKYSIKNFLMQQHKLEVRGKNFFVRGYTTSEDAGDSYNTLFAALNINRAWKDDSTWFGQYTGAYLQGTLGGLNSDQAHAGARLQADDAYTLQPGTAEFNAAYDQIIDNPDVNEGSKFVDQTKMYVGEGNYNFRSLLKDYMDLQVGGSYRQYSLNSDGTIFTDYDGPIEYGEFGIYSQLQKEVDLNAAMKLKLTGSIRYDKSEFFEGFLSPRFSAGLTVNDNHNFRGSIQTGFRNPTTQDLFIGLDAGRALLVGSAPDNLDRYTNDFPVSVGGQGLLNLLSGGQGAPSSITQTGRSAYENSYTLNSVEAFGASGGATPLEVANLSETIAYEDFIANTNVIVPYNASGAYKIFQLYSNSTADISSYGTTLKIKSIEWL